MSAGERIAEAARAKIGTRFRLHGQGGAHGIDCIGLAAAALRGAGIDAPVPRGYRIGDDRVAAVVKALRQAGLSEIDCCLEPLAGDIVIARSGARQLHLAIATGGGLVHADAVIGRVVERPGAPPWPLIALWRVVEPGER